MKRINGGIIGQFTLPTTTSTGVLYSVTEASGLSSVGQFPTLANVTVPALPQTGNTNAPITTSLVYADPSYNTTTANAAQTANAYVRLFGTNFDSGSTVYINGQLPTTTTYISSTEIRVRTTQTLTANTIYPVTVVNSSNIGSIYYPGIQYQPVPSWSTAANIGYTAFNTYYTSTLLATGAVGISYSVVSGSLPANITLASNGVLSGAAPNAPGSAYQSSFTIRANSAYGLTTDQTFNWNIGYYPVQWFVVAGGGGGGGGSTGGPSGATAGGGGGGGGIVPQTASVYLGYGLPYVVSVGAGGGGGATGVRGVPGWNSNITTGGTFIVSAVGGGGGGSNFPLNAGLPGGSGGGAGGTQVAPSPIVTGATGTTGQGNSGGGFTPGNPAPTAGGGGGAGGAGGAGTPVTGLRGTGRAGTPFGYPQLFSYGGRGGSPLSFATDSPVGTFTGNGGSGGQTNTTTSGYNGASGTVIISVPTTYYNGPSFGPAPALTTTVIGANTIVRFNGSGTFTG